jgi:hypothetical protein
MVQGTIDAKRPACGTTCNFGATRPQRNATQGNCLVHSRRHVAIEREVWIGLLCWQLPACVRHWIWESPGVARPSMAQLCQRQSHPAVLQMNTMHLEGKHGSFPVAVLCVAYGYSTLMPHKNTATGRKPCFLRSCVGTHGVGGHLGRERHGRSHRQCHTWTGQQCTVRVKAVHADQSRVTTAVRQHRRAPMAPEGLDVLGRGEKKGGSPVWCCRWHLLRPAWHKSCSRVSSSCPCLVRTPHMSS